MSFYNNSYNLGPTGMGIAGVPGVGGGFGPPMGGGYGLGGGMGMDPMMFGMGGMGMPWMGTGMMPGMGMGGMMGGGYAGADPSTDLAFRSQMDSFQRQNRH